MERCFKHGKTRSHILQNAFKLYVNENEFGYIFEDFFCMRGTSVVA
jgi:hypothetical protein